MKKTLIITSIFLLTFTFLPKAVSAQTFLPITPTNEKDYCIITSFDISSLAGKNAKELVSSLGVSSDAVFFRGLNRLTTTEKEIKYILLEEVMKDSKAGCVVSKEVSSDLNLKYWATFAMKAKVYSDITKVVPFEIVKSETVVASTVAEVPVKLTLGQKISSFFKRITSSIVAVFKKIKIIIIKPPTGGGDEPQVGYIKLVVGSGSIGAQGHQLEARVNPADINAKKLCSASNGYVPQSCLFTYPAGTTVKFYPQILPPLLGAAYQGGWLQTGASGPNQCAITPGTPLPNDAHYCGDVGVLAGQTKTVELNLRLVK